MSRLRLTRDLDFFKQETFSLCSQTEVPLPFTPPPDTVHTGESVFLLYLEVYLTCRLIMIAPSSLLEACAHPQPRGLIVLHRILPKEVILQS